MPMKQLTEERRKAVADMREIVDRAHEEKRAMSSDEQEKFDKVYKIVDDLKQRIDEQSKVAKLESELASIPEEQRALPLGETGASGGSKQSERHLDAFRSWLVEGAAGLVEYRDLQANILTSGGSFVPPVEWVNQLIKAVDNNVFMRTKATTFRLTTAQSLGAPSLEADPSDPDWTSEVPGADPTADTTMATGARELKPSPLVKLVKLSKTLMRSSAIPVEQLVRDRLAYKFGVAEENNYLNGSGAGRPLGIFYASAQGIDTSRDVSTDNTTTAMTYDGLINAKYSVKSAYWPTSDWIFHRDGQKQLVKIKDSNNNYIWRESVSANEPDTLLGRPINLSEYCPNTFTTGLYVGAFGSLQHYWIVDAMDVDIQRLNEKYALRRQIGFLGDKETDGMPVLAEAFARVTLA